MSVAQTSSITSGTPTPRTGYQNSKSEEYARWRRRDHANIEAMQNLVIARIAELAGVELPPNVRCLISALQGAHGGGETAFEEFSRDYLSLGAQLQFKGTEEAIRQRVRRWIDDLLTWQRDVGFELFAVVKGGEVVGQRPDGTPIRKATTFIDNLKPHADDAVQRARQSDLWRGNAQKGIRPHPGKAIEAEVESLLKALPRIKPEPDGDGGKKSGAKMSVGEYERQREEAIVKALENAADEIEERDGDADLWLEKMERAVRKMRDSRRKTAPARRSWIMFDEDELEPTKASSSGNTNTGITPEPQSALEAARLGITDDTQVEAETIEKTMISEPALGITDDTQADAEIPENSEYSEPENAPDVLEWALTFASMGVPVFPLTPRAKMPLGKLVPHGVKDASTDEATITRWFKAEPQANLGIAMGGSLRLLAVDIDPRAGGDANLESLCDAHGLEWLDTFTVKTGGGGWHFLYRLPEGVEVHRGKLAPGVDIKAAGGYLVAPPSIHPNGQRYEVEKSRYPTEAPVWLVEELTRKPDEPLRVAIDFQTHRDRQPSGGGSVIVEGERNERLFKVGCAMWGKGEVGSRGELLQKLMETNIERVSPPLDSDEVYKIVESICARYALGVPIQGGAA